MVRGWCRTNDNRSASKAGHDAKKNENVRDCCGADSVQRGGRVVNALNTNMSLERNGKRVRCMVVRFVFFAHTSQFNASNRKWSTAEALSSARQYTQEQRDVVTE